MREYESGRDKYGEEGFGGGGEEYGEGVGREGMVRENEEKRGEWRRREG